jgi:hypothetical protein
MAQNDVSSQPAPPAIQHAVTKPPPPANHDQLPQSNRHLVTLAHLPRARGSVHCSPADAVLQTLITTTGQKLAEWIEAHENPAKGTRVAARTPRKKIQSAHPVRLHSRSNPDRHPTQFYVQIHGHTIAALYILLHFQSLATSYLSC